MKKCRQCGILSADTAVACRNCNAKFTEEDKPIVVVAPIKKKRTALSIITVAIVVIAIALFALYQTGMLRTWAQQADKNKINAIAEEFVKADFAKDTEKLKSYMFDQYIEVNEKQGAFSLEKDEYVSFKFFLYNPNPASTIEIVNITTDIYSNDEFDIYYSEINRKYSVEPTEIASVTVEVRINHDGSTAAITAPMLAAKIDKEWYILPIL